MGLAVMQDAIFPSAELKKLVKEHTDQIFKTARLRLTSKYKEPTTTDIYRGLAREILKREGPMEKLILAKTIEQAMTNLSFLNEPLVPAFTINNLFEHTDNEEPLIMFPEGDKYLIGLISQYIPKI